MLVQQRIRHATWRIIRRAAAEAALGACCAAAFGEFFGGLWVLDEGERLWRAAATALFMGLCGALVCGLVGAIGGLTEEISAWPTTKCFADGIVSAAPRSTLVVRRA